MRRATANGIPDRPADARPGSAVLAATDGLSYEERDQVFADELAGGNLPEFLRSFIEIELTASDGAGAQTVVVRVMPDYLAVGSDDDWVRVPLMCMSAQSLADAWGMQIPTTKVVDAAWQQAALRLTPYPLPAGPDMGSNAYIAKHQERIEEQRGDAPHDLTAGQKKDVVVSNRLASHPSSVAIYGWHGQDGVPIQPLSTAHAKTYTDYSHGIRLVGGTVRVDGEDRPFADVVADSALAGLLSDEGPITTPHY
ncbi:hypothetical protein [Streptomyces sp. NPDC051776]|uniref:hypothetical protein n=1 Tax=Streptomyces sp. NPDC051776 TaxID=3155414 RepID=UPI00343DD147